MSRSLLVHLLSRVSMDARRGGGAAAPAPIETPIAPGEVEVRAQATVTVAIR